jgi:hypothetical protein
VNWNFHAIGITEVNLAHLNKCVLIFSYVKSEMCVTYSTKLVSDVCNSGLFPILYD